MVIVQAPALLPDSVVETEPELPLMVKAIVAPLGRFTGVPLQVMLRMVHVPFSESVLPGVPPVPDVPPDPQAMASIARQTPKAPIAVRWRRG